MWTSQLTEGIPSLGALQRESRMERQADVKELTDRVDLSEGRGESDG